MKAILCGANGAMGKLVDQRLGDEVVARVSIDGANGVYTHFSQLPALSADVVIDFSHHSAIADVLDYCKSTGTAAVIGTTGHTEAEKALIYEAAKTIPVFYSGNVSLGIAILCRLAKEAASYFPDADITERWTLPAVRRKCSFPPFRRSGPMPWPTADVPGRASGKRTRSASAPCGWAVLWASMRSISAPRTRC